MNKTPRPLFVLSLPRSGSTLLQRLLAARKEIATTAEPWLLLPLIYAMRTEGSYSEYGHQQAVTALQDFYKALPEHSNTYESELREFALRLYRHAAGQDAAYFLDKTPRYHLLVDDLVRIFPDARLIFLWRNPLAVVASMMEHAAPGGRWNLYLRKVDLFEGLERLLLAHDRYRERACSVRYEDLVKRPAGEMAKIWSYLGLEFDSDSEIQMEARPPGRMGDDTGTYRYEDVSSESLTRWRATLNNPVRKAWCRRYLHWIGEERLSQVGYSLSELKAELNQVPMTLRRTGSDISRLSYGLLWCSIEPHLLRAKMRRLPSWRRIHGHT